MPSPAEMAREREAHQLAGQPSIDEDVLTQLVEGYPLPKLLLEHRSLSKLKSTYADKLPRMVNPQTGRVHTSFSQATAVTGRLASSDPNLPNIPIRTPEGRGLHLPEIRAQQAGRRQAAERAAINAPMQGTTADLIKRAMIAVSGWLKSSGVQSRLILQVHDELVLEVPNGELHVIRAELPKLMAGVAELASSLLT